MTRLDFFSLCGALSLTVAAFAADDPNRPITYDDDVRPIFRAHCFKCHGEQEQKGGLALDTYAEVIKGGNGEEVVKPGRPNSSSLFLAVARESDDVAAMPPKQPKIPDAEIEVLRKWIQGGLLEKVGGKSKAPARTAVEFKAAAAPVAAGDGPMPGALPPYTPPAQKRENSATALAASPNAPLAAVAGFEHIKLIDTKKRATIGALAFPEGVAHALRFSRDGSVLLAAGGRGVKLGKVVLFDVKTGKRMGEYGDDIDEILAADISPDLKLIAYGGPGKLVKVCSTKDGALLYKINKHTDWVTALEFSPDGARLATADRAGGVHVWEAGTGGIVLSLTEHKESVNSLSWRADSQVLATGGEDGQLIVWDVKEGWPMTSTKPHEPKSKGKTYGKLPNGVMFVKFANDGRLFTAGRDNSLRVWTPEGKRVGSADNLPALPTRIANNFDDKFVIVGDLRGNLHYSNGSTSEPLFK